MFWNKKVDPRPFGVNLDELSQLLSACNLGVKQSGDGLIVKHRELETLVAIERPEIAETENGLIKAIVKIKTYLPKEISHFLSTPESTVAMNAMVTLGALTVEDGKLFIGSRVTIYEEEDAWNIHLPLIFFATIINADSLLGAMGKTFTGAELNHSDSDWVDEDFDNVERILSTICVCTTGHLGLTAEFSLREGEVSAVAGHHRTALWQLSADEPHPEMGGGCLCMLQLPHQISDESKLKKIIVQLNQMDMAANDLPPHFGAWCIGRMGDNPAYVSFLPNALHSVDGISVNFSIWANARAQWANAMLASLGVTA